MKYLKFAVVLKRYWWILALLLVVIPLISSSITEAKLQEDWKIVPIMIGDGLVSTDNVIYEQLKEKKYDFEKSNGIEDSINKTAVFFWDLMNGLWMYIWIYMALVVAVYKSIHIIFYKNVQRAFIKVSLWTFAIFGILQIIVSGVPFRGILLFTQTLWGFFSSL